MLDEVTFPITSRWTPERPETIQLYSMPTPNGVKVSIMLEETGLPYEAHLVDITGGESHETAFLTLNPAGKIPAIIDPNGPGGRPIGIFESGAILLYLADKTGSFISSDAEIRLETIQWLFFQMASVGPMFGQVGYFNRFAGREIEDKRPLMRYVAESKRLLGILDSRVAAREYIVGSTFTIADIAHIGWVRNLIGFYEARELVDYDSLRHLPTWLDRCLSRPAVQRGLAIPAKS